MNNYENIEEILLDYEKKVLSLDEATFYIDVYYNKETNEQETIDSYLKLFIQKKKHKIKL
jgi:hypothetical protein